MRSAQARRHNGVLVAALSTVCAALTAAGCTGGGSTPVTPNPQRTAVLTGTPSDWPTFGHDSARTARAGVDTPHLRPNLSAGRSVRLDGPVYGQPLLVGDTVFAATENDSAYAVSALDGSILWRTHLAEPFHPHGCGNIQPLGITGTPVYAGGRLYLVVEDAGAHHILTMLDAATGAVRHQKTIDPPVGDRAFLQQRPALSMSDGRVYAAFGGLFGDCGTYTGAVAVVDVARPDGMDGGPGSTPADDDFHDVAWYTASTSGRGGIWAPGAAPAVGDRLYFSVGNGDAQGTSPWDGSDSVVALGPHAQRADAFAPAQWPADNAADADLGSMNPALVNGHIVIAGKAGLGYVLDPGNLGGVTARTPAFDHCAGFGAAAVDGELAYLPCASGVIAVQVAADGSASVLWRASVPADGSPTIGAGYVWSTDYSSGILYALDPSSGKVAGQTKTDPLPHFASPSMSAAGLVLGTMTGIEIFTG